GGSADARKPGRTRVDGGRSRSHTPTPSLPGLARPPRWWPTAAGASGPGTAGPDNTRRPRWPFDVHGFEMQQVAFGPPRARAHRHLCAYPIFRGGLAFLPPPPPLFYSTLFPS